MIIEYPEYSKVKKRDALYSAWRKVYENGVISKSEETRNEIKKFGAIALVGIGQIQYQLSRDQFSFAPATGIPIRRLGKKDRPIVISPIPKRIVQRSILDVLQQNPAIKDYVTVPTSFGGIEKRGVPTAIKTAYEAIQNGASWYLRSDIEGFFTQIPRDKVLRIISKTISDQKFIELIDSAVTTELANLHELGKKAELFPIYDIGVAQGCCLSPLIGNLLLHDFDAKMNVGGITCLRYIEDFLILGADQRAVTKAFNKALHLLKEHNLQAYHPLKNKDKAEIGKTEKGFEFLGCDIHPGLIRPSKKSRKRLLVKIEDLFKDSMQLMSKPKQLSFKRKSFIETLDDASNIIRGWGNQYSFCNDTSSFNSLDDKIDELIRNYAGHYKRAIEALKPEHQKNRRRLLGVHLLCDSKRTPIIK